MYHEEELYTAKEHLKMLDVSKGSGRLSWGGHKWLEV